MKKLGTLLEEAGVIDEIQLVRALSHQRKWRCRLGHSLVELGFVTEETIAKTVSQQLNIPYREFDPQQTPAELLDMVPHDVAEEKRLFPLGYSVTPAGKSILIAMAEPADKAALISLERATGVRIDPVVAKDGAIEDAIRGWERFKKSNKRSSPESLITSAQQEVKPAAPHSAGEKFFDGADDEWPEDMDETDNASEPKPGARTGFEPTPVKKSPPSDIFLKGMEPSAAPSAGMKEPEEILSVSGLPPIDEQDELLGGPELTPPETLESTDIIAKPTEAVPETEVESQEIQGITHSETWEHIMPGVDAGKLEELPHEKAESGFVMDDSGMQEIGEAEVDHAQPWESVMPGVDAAAEVVEDLRRPIAPIEQEESERESASPKEAVHPELTRSEPWEHIMPGVDSAAQNTDIGGIEGPPPEEETPPELSRSEPWEHIMPGVDSAAQNTHTGGIEGPPPEEETPPELSRSEPWEHIMPGVDSAAQNTDTGGIGEPPPEDIEILEGADLEEPEGWAQPDQPSAPAQPSAPPKLETQEESFNLPVSTSPPPHIISTPPPGAPELKDIFSEEVHTDKLLESLQEFTPEPPPVEPPPVTIAPPPPPVPPIPPVPSVPLIPPVPPSRPAPLRTEPEIEKPKEEIAAKEKGEEPTLDEISGELQDLKSQVSLLRKEMGILKDALVKKKREK